VLVCTPPQAVRTSAAAAVAASAVAGVGFCWLRLRAGSLLAPALLHVATNSLAYAAAWVVLS
jgi:membrane protease YdiL (CAAX protease family)